MRVRMAQLPGLVERVQSETIPVSINLTDQGFPAGIPALASWWDKVLDVNPWVRLGFGHYVLIDAAGERLYGATGCYGNGRRLHDMTRLRRQLDRYLRLEALWELASGAASKIAALEQDLAVELSESFSCLFEPRLLTVFALYDRAAVPWTTIFEMLRRSPSQAAGPLAPGIREAVIRALGDLLVEERPLDPFASQLIQALHDLVSRSSATQTPDDAGSPGTGIQLSQALLDRVSTSSATQASDGAGSPGVGIPLLFQRKAALSLAEIVGQSWSGTDQELIDAARTWWRRHRTDPAYRVVWASDPSTRTTFALSAFE